MTISRDNGPTNFPLDHKKSFKPKLHYFDLLWIC